MKFGYWMLAAVCAVLVTACGSEGNGTGTDEAPAGSGSAPPAGGGTGAVSGGSPPGVATGMDQPAMPTPTDGAATDDPTMMPTVDPEGTPMEPGVTPEPAMAMEPVPGEPEMMGEPEMPGEPELPGEPEMPGEPDVTMGPPDGAYEACSGTPVPGLALNPVVENLDLPIFAATPNGDAPTMFVAERGGALLRVNLDDGSSTTLMEVNTSVDSECGFLSFALGWCRCHGARFRARRGRGRACRRRRNRGGIGGWRRVRGHRAQLRAVAVVFTLRATKCEDAPKRERAE